jgi:hypothetical protein
MRRIQADSPAASPDTWGGIALGDHSRLLAAMAGRWMVMTIPPVPEPRASGRRPAPALGAARPVARAVCTEPVAKDTAPRAEILLWPNAAPCLACRKPACAPVEVEEGQRGRRPDPAQQRGIAPCRSTSISSMLSARRSCRRSGSTQIRVIKRRVNLRRAMQHGHPSASKGSRTGPLPGAIGPSQPVGCFGAGSRVECAAQPAMMRRVMVTRRARTGQRGRLQLVPAGDGPAERFE